jgi:spoIIIJ-associated protein
LTEAKYTAKSIGPQISEFLHSVLTQAGFELKYEILEPDNPHPEFENPDAMVKFSGPDVELLLNNRAELLLALEHLTMEMLRMPPEDHSRLCFDANDYRVLRIEELRLSAVTAADKVRRSGVPFRFNPMTSRERRILHLALRDEAGVRSESSGFGGNRQVVIYPEGMPSQPEQAPTRPGRFVRKSRRR